MLGRSVRHAVRGSAHRPIQVRELRVYDVVVTVSEIAARQSLSKHAPAIAILVDRIVNRIRAHGRVHPSHTLLLVHKEKFYPLASPWWWLLPSNA